MDIEFDTKQLESLLKSLSLITGQKITLKDNKYNNIMTSSKSCEFCTLIQNTAIGYEKCMDCDKIALKKAGEQNSVYFYRCHAGLWETAIPISEDGNPFAYLMFGQFLGQDSREEQWKDIEKNIGWHSNLSALKKAFGNISQLDQQSVEAYAEVISACASYICHKEYLRHSDISDYDRISNYVNRNYTRKLNLDTICNEMNVGRTKLFETVKREFGCSIQQLLKKKRMEVAASLLENTDQRIVEISRKVGIDDSNYFVKIFKSERGSTPSEYRSLARSNNREQTPITK